MNVKSPMVAIMGVDSGKAIRANVWLNPAHGQGVAHRVVQLAGEGVAGGEVTALLLEPREALRGRRTEQGGSEPAKELTGAGEDVRGQHDQQHADHESHHRRQVREHTERFTQDGDVGELAQQEHHTRGHGGEQDERGRATDGEMRRVPERPTAAGGG